VTQVHSGPPHAPPAERGSASVELAIVMPLVMLLLMVIVQAGIYFHTQAVATTAAREAVDAARVSGGSPAAGSATAGEFLSQSGRALEDRHVAVSRTPTLATATVSGRVASVLFGFPFHVSVTVSAPLERVTP
jgi:Flp pilus assembly protein TadG